MTREAAFREQQYAQTSGRRVSRHSGLHQDQAAERPSLYRVLLLNDEYTPMEFVVTVLERFFHKDHETAKRIMLHVHQHGVGECGIYTYEVAETKVMQVMDFSLKHSIHCNA
jgi:ATP-dependent Clp protease adapter protein ClpS